MVQGVVPEDPLVFLVREQLVLEGIAAKEVVKEIPAVGLGDHQQGVVVTRAGDFDGLSVDLGAVAGVRFCVGVPESVHAVGLAGLEVFDQAREPGDHRVHIVDHRAELATVETPDDFITQPGFCVGVLLNLPEQVVKESALTAAGRATEEVDLVLLGPAFERFH